MSAHRYRRVPRKMKPRLRKLLTAIWLLTLVVVFFLPWAYGLVVALLATCIHFAATEEVVSLENR